MGTSLIRNIILALVLVVLSFLLGITAADSTKDALMIFVIISGVIFFVALGKKIWMAIFLLTPFCAFYPSLVEFPTAHLLYVAIFIYWLMLWMLGHVKLTWRRLLPLDILISVFMAYMVFSYVRNPVSVSFLEQFGIVTDNIGGKEYFISIVAFASYIALSAIPFPKDKLLNVLKWGLVISLTVMVLNSFRGALIGNDEYETMAEEVSKSRFSYFSTLGTYITILVYGCVPFSKLLLSPKYLLLLILGFLSVLISGWRTSFVVYGASVIGCSLIKKEVFALIACVIVTYGGLMYMGETGFLHQTPMGVQRVLSLLPGVRVNAAIARGAQASSDWRVEMWKRALDPRTGLIKDYLFGDGPTRSKSYIIRHYRALHRGETWSGDQRFFSETKQWHSGIITNLSVLGIVGSIIMLSVQVLLMVWTVCICRALRGSAYYIYSLYNLIPALFAGFFFYYISTGVVGSFLGTFPAMAFLKMYYNIAIEEGRLRPWSWKKRYVPILIQEQGKMTAVNPLSAIF